jgi:hypothetical protein
MRRVKAVSFERLDLMMRRRSEAVSILPSHQYRDFTAGAVLTHAASFSPTSAFDSLSASRAEDTVTKTRIAGVIFVPASSRQILQTAFSVGANEPFHHGRVELDAGA